MKTKHLVKGMAFLFFILETVYLSAQDAGEILRKVDEVMYSAKDMSGVQVMELTDKNGKTEVREAMIMQKGTEMRLIRFISPASQEGIAILSLPGELMYLYLPAFARERRISSSAKNQNFAGTDFSYEDLEARAFSSKYTAKMIREEENLFVLELTPINSSGVYSRIVAHISKMEYYPEMTQFFDQAGNKIKEARYRFSKVGKYWSPDEIKMADLKKSHTTVMRLKEVKYDTGLTEDEFTIRKLVQ